MDKTERLILTVIILLFLVLCYASYKDSKNWQKFSIEHNCKIVSKISGSTNVGVGTGIMTNGQFGTGTIITTTPNKTSYLCDDGVTYYR